LEPIIPGLLSEDYLYDDQEGEQLEGRLAMIVNQLRKQKMGCYQPVKVVKQPGAWLLEDEGRGRESYPDFLCKLHRLI
jgi:hypothetical protein